MSARCERNVRLVRILGLMRAGYNRFDSADACDISDAQARRLRARALAHEDAIVAMLRDGTEHTAIIPVRATPWA